jgi:hypothetical protein
VDEITADKNLIMTSRLLILFTFLTSFAFCQTSDSDIKKIDSYKLNIDNKLTSKKLTEKFYPNMSALGGAVYGYYADKKLVLIKTQFNAEAGYHSIDFYILNDTLVYAFEKQRQIKEPDNKDDYDAYIKKYSDKKGNIDFSKIPLSVCADNVYYLVDNHIIQSQMKSFGKKTKLMEDVIADKNSMLLRHYKSHLKELTTVK